MQWEYGLLIIGILFIIAAMFSISRKRKQTAGKQVTGRDHIERARQKQGVRDELEALMVDINRMARDMGAQLDAKIVRIEKASREADERIAQLQALRDSFDPATVAPPTRHHTQAENDLAYENLITPQRPPDQADPLTREVYALADSGLGPTDIAEQLGEHIGKVELILALRSG